MEITDNVTLVGHLTKNPDLHYTASGTAVATFTLAVNRNFANQNGNRKADFINCVIWCKPAETMAALAKKGGLIGVIGRIQTRTYDNQQGQRVYVTEVVADNLQLLENKAAAESRAHADQSTTSPSPATFEQRDTNNGLDASQNPFGGQSIDISGDNLPF